MKYITLFCSSTTGAINEYVQVAQTLGSLLVEHNIGLNYGGADVGLMKATADKVIENNGIVNGITTKQLSTKHKAPANITQITIVETLSLRKAKLIELGDGFIVLPGGFGTLDELFEVLASAQLNLHSKPIIIINTNAFYNFLKLHVETMIKEKMLLNEHATKVIFVDTAEQAINFFLKNS